MGFLDDILSRTRVRAPQHMRAWPVGKAEVFAWDTQWGHDDSRFSPPEYGDYLATSNDIYSLAMSRARLLSGLDLQFFHGEGQKRKTIEDHRAVELYQYVNPFWGRRRLARMDELSMCLWGESFWAVEKPNRDSPMGEIWWMKPDRVRVAFHPTKYIAGFWYWPMQGPVGAPIWFDAEEAIWFRYPNPIDEQSALSPLAAAKLAADTSKAMMQGARRMHDRGMQIAGLVTPMNPDLTFTEDQADDLEQYMQKKLSGPTNAGRWAVLRHEAKFQQMSITPKDAELVQGLNLSFRQVCRAYGMQPTLHGDLEQASPGDTKELERIEWARTLAPDAMLRAEDIEERYLPMFAGEKGAPDYCEFDFSKIPALQESEGAVWDREAGQVDRGLMTINEWRQRRGMKDVLWGDEPWLPMNKGQYLKNGEEPKGKIAIPGADPFGAGGMGSPFGTSADAGWSGDGQQGGPVPLDDNGSPSEVLPDDEWNPSVGNERSHWSARRFLTHPQVRDFLAEAFPDGMLTRRLNGHRPPALTR